MVSETLPAPDIVLANCGSIAAYKGVELLRLLVARGLRVQPLQTANARRFVGGETLSALSGYPCLSEMFVGHGGEPHVDLSRTGARMLIAPATADILARLAQGRADDLVSATALCWPGPIWLAPAMHPRMWSQPATQRNVKQLIEDGHHFLGPVDGVVASGETGVGRMLEPAEIVERLFAKGSLAGKRIIVSAGPTFEEIDPVRFIGNRSSGKMGFAIAALAAARGAQVDLVAGPVNLPTPRGVQRRDIRSARDLEAELQELTRTPSDALIMAAAVGDYRPQDPSSTKLERGADFALKLVANTDIIAGLARHLPAPRPVLMAFALETGSDEAVIARAQAKLARKGVDVIVANTASDAFLGDTNRVHLISDSAVTSYPTLPKTEVAARILDWLETRWNDSRL